jgi:hypothetical protein
VSISIDRALAIHEGLAGFATGMNWSGTIRQKYETFAVESHGHIELSALIFERSATKISAISIGIEDADGRKTVWVKLPYRSLRNDPGQTHQELIVLRQLLCQQLQLDVSILAEQQPGFWHPWLILKAHTSNDAGLRNEPRWGAISHA